MKKLLFPVILGLVAALLVLSALPQAFQAQAQGSGLPLNVMFNATTTPAVTPAGTPTPQYFPYSATPGKGVLWSDPTFAGDKFEHPKQFEFFYDLTGDASITNTATLALEISPDRVHWYSLDNSTTNVLNWNAPGNSSGYISGTVQGVWVRLKWTQSSTPTLYPDLWLVIRGETGKY